MSQIEDTTVAYKAAKAIKSGQKLWCLWSENDPYGKVIGAKKTGFVLDKPTDMRRMAADLFRLADAIEELENMWEDDQ